MGAIKLAIPLAFVWWALLAESRAAVGSAVSALVLGIHYSRAEQHKRYGATVT